MQSSGGRITWGTDARFPRWAHQIIPTAIQNALFNLPTLHFESASGTSQPLTDEDWAELHARLDPHRGRIISIVFSGSNIGDKSVRTCVEYPYLSVLDLSGTRVTDDGLAELAGVQHLTTLILDHTSITEEALEQLRAHPYLLYLSVVNTGLPENALQSLEADIPGLMVLDD